MRKIQYLLTTAIIVALLLVGCSSTDVSITEIFVVNPPQTEYLINSQLDLTDGKIKVVYSNGTTDTIEMTNADVSVDGFNASTIGEQTLTITYKEKTTSLKVTVIARAATELEFSTEPSKKTYYVGEALDLSGAVLRLKYNDGTHENIAIADTTVAGFDESVQGAQTVTVSYNGFNATVVVTVYPDSINTIEVTTPPEKLEYFPSEPLNLAGGELTITYSSGKTEKVALQTSGVTVTGFSSASGEQTLTVNYNNFVTDFTITVLEITSIEIENVPSKLTYTATDTELDLTGGTVTLYAEGKEITLSLSDPLLSVSGFTAGEYGTKVITVEAFGFKATFNITIVDPTAEYILSTDLAEIYEMLADTVGYWNMLVNSTGGDLDSDTTFFMLQFLYTLDEIAAYLDSDGENKQTLYNYEVTVPNAEGIATLAGATTYSLYGLFEILYEYGYELFLGDMINSESFIDFYFDYLELAEMYIADTDSAKGNDEIHELYQQFLSLTYIEQINFYFMLNIYYNPPAFIGYEFNVFNLLLEEYYFNEFSTEDEEYAYWYIRYAEEVYALFNVDVTYILLFKSVMVYCQREYNTITDATVFDTYFLQQYQYYVDTNNSLPDIDISNPNPEKIAILTSINTYLDTVYEAYFEIYDAFYAYYVEGKPLQNIDTTIFMVHYMNMLRIVDEQILNSGDTELIVLYSYYTEFDGGYSLEYWVEYLETALFSYNWFISDFLGDDETMLAFYNHYLELAYKYYFDSSYAGSAEFNQEMPVLFEWLLSLDGDYQTAFFITLNIGYSGNNFYGMDYIMFVDMINTYYFSKLTGKEISAYIFLQIASEQLALYLYSGDEDFLNGFAEAMEKMIAAYAEAQSQGSTAFDAELGSLYTALLAQYTQLTQAT